MSKIQVKILDPWSDIWSSLRGDGVGRLETFGIAIALCRLFKVSRSFKILSFLVVWATYHKSIIDTLVLRETKSWVAKSKDGALSWISCENHCQGKCISVDWLHLFLLVPNFQPKLYSPTSVCKTESNISYSLTGVEFDPGAMGLK